VQYDVTGSYCNGHVTIQFDPVIFPVIGTSVSAQPINAFQRRQPYTLIFMSMPAANNAHWYKKVVPVHGQADFSNIHLLYFLLTVYIKTLWYLMRTIITGIPGYFLKQCSICWT